MFRRLRQWCCSTGVKTPLRAARQLETDIAWLLAMLVVCMLVVNFGSWPHSPDELAVVVVIQHGGLTLKNCLTAVQRHLPRHPVYLVDMSPGDDARRSLIESLVAELGDDARGVGGTMRLTLLPDKKDRGWPGAVNAGVMETPFETSDVLLLMDGVEVTVETVPALLAARQRGGSPAASAKLGTPDGTVSHAGYDFVLGPYPEEPASTQWGYNSWQRHDTTPKKNTVLPTPRFQGLSLQDPRVNTESPPAAVGFGCALVAVGAFLELKGIETGFGHRRYAEVDFALRLVDRPPPSLVPTPLRATARLSECLFGLFTAGLQGRSPSRRRRRPRLDGARWRRMCGR